MSRRWPAGVPGDDIEACLENQALFDTVKAMRAQAGAKLEIASTPDFLRRRGQAEGRARSGED
jgi:hypothetical protein